MSSANSSEQDSGDSPLSTSANVIGILTFGYALLFGAAVLVIQLRNSTADIKRFVKSVAFLALQVRELPQVRPTAPPEPEPLIPYQGGAATKFAIRALFDDRLEVTQDVAVRRDNFVRDFQQLVDAARGLGSLVGDQMPSDADLDGQQLQFPGLIRLWNRLDWIWTHAEKVEMLLDMRREYEAVHSLLMEAKNVSQRRTGDFPSPPQAGTRETWASPTARPASRVDWALPPAYGDWAFLPFSSQDPYWRHCQLLDGLDGSAGEFLIRSPEVEGWLGRGNSVLLLSGTPGSGKSTMTALVARALRRLSRPIPEGHAAYFYFDFRQKPALSAVLLSLFAQLTGRSDNSYSAGIIDQYTKWRGENNAPVLDEIEKMMREKIRDGHRARVFLLDGLDQYDRASRRLLLRLISTLQNHVILKLFVTSTHDPTVAEDLSDDLHVRVHKLDLREVDATGDARVLFEVHLEPLSSFLPRNLYLQRFRDVFEASDRK